MLSFYLLVLLQKRDRLRSLSLGNLGRASPGERKYKHHTHYYLLEFLLPPLINRSFFHQLGLISSFTSSRTAGGYIALLSSLYSSSTGPVSSYSLSPSPLKEIACFCLYRLARFYLSVDLDPYHLDTITHELLIDHDAQRRPSSFKVASRQTGSSKPSLSSSRNVRSGLLGPYRPKYNPTWQHPFVEGR